MAKKTEPKMTYTEILSFAGTYLVDKIIDNNNKFGDNAAPLNEFYHEKLDCLSVLYEMETGRSPNWDI